MTDSRLITAQILQDILENKTFASEAKSRFETEINHDSAFINMLLQTSLRHIVLIKKILQKYIKKKLPAKNALVQYALILAVSEILWLNTPDYAVLNSYVEFIKKRFDKYLAGFANAVLRKVIADKETFSKQPEEFFPPEFYQILKNSYDKETIHKIEQCFLKEPLLDISCKENNVYWATKLEGFILPNGTIRLHNNGNITKLTGYNEGAWWVQDFSASLAVQQLSPNLTNKKILDLCAAPGGKTAQLLAAGATVTALDISQTRLKRLQENIKRLQLPQPEIICQDAITYLQSIAAPIFDAILLDAPCSATGTLRRHPELVHIKNQTDVLKQASLQKEILSLIFQALKPGGTLIYCVCSLSKAEGENQINEFLQNNLNFKRKRAKLSADISEIITPEGDIRTLPFHLEKFGGTDGFFIACIQKDN